MSNVLEQNFLGSLLNKVLTPEVKEVGKKESGNKYFEELDSDLVADDLNDGVTDQNVPTFI